MMEQPAEANSKIDAARIAADCDPGDPMRPRSRQQTTTEALAVTIERHYVFPSVARQVAALVRTWAEPAGEPPFQEWTLSLRAFDRHFRVEPAKPVSRHDSGSDGATASFVEVRAREQVGVLRIAEFVDPDSDAHEAEVIDALQRLQRFEAIVVDLRGNGGGWPTMVAIVAGPLLGAEPVHVLDFQTRSSSETSFTTPLREVRSLASKPLAVLIDEGTASAAESFAYLMASTSRALVVGRTSAGAANPGDWFDTGAGMAAFISTGSPIDPRTGTNWEGVGVVPDLWADIGDAEDVAVRHLERLLTHQCPYGQDRRGNKRWVDVAGQSVEE